MKWNIIGLALVLSFLGVISSVVCHLAGIDEKIVDSMICYSSVLCILTNLIGFGLSSIEEKNQKKINYEIDLIGNN